MTTQNICQLIYEYHYLHVGNTLYIKKYEEKNVQVYFIFRVLVLHFRLPMLFLI